MTETIEVPSLGQQLKTARERLGLSISDVVERTNLKKNHIDAFENDIFILQNVPPAFARGYVRNYVRFLRLSETLIDSVHYGEVTIPKEVKRTAPIKVGNNHKSQRRWVRTFTWLILLGAAGMTLAWWWQEHQKDQASRDALVNNTEITAVQTQDNAQTVSQETSRLVDTPTDIPLSNNSTTSQTNEDPPLLTPDQTKPLEKDGVENTQSDLVNVLHQQPEQAESSIVADPQNESVVINDELRIEIKGGQSWIMVKSAKGKRLAEKLYNEGEVLTFNDNGQYHLTIGAPANVKIHYNGQQVPLKVDGRVARFKLPLAN